MIERLSNFWQSRVIAHKSILQLLIAIGFVAYGQRAFNNYLYSDDYWRSHLWYLMSVVGSGRFTMTAVWYVMGPDFAPAFSATLFLILSALSAISIAKLIGAKDEFDIFLFSSLMIINPVVCRHIQFLPHQVPIAVGFVLLALVCELMHKILKAKFQNHSSIKTLLLCSFLQALMLGIRQDFITLSAVLFLAIILKLLGEFSQVSFKQIINSLAHCISMLVVSLAIYYLLNRLSHYLTGESEFKGSYSTFSSIATNKSDLIQAANRAASFMYNYFIDANKKVAWGVKITFATAFFMFIVSVINTAKTKYNWNIFIAILFGFLISLLVIVTPWLPAFVRNYSNTVSLTALMGLVGTWSVVYSYVSINGSSLAVKRAAKVLGTLALVIFIFSSSRSSFEIQMKHDQLNILAVQLLNEVKQEVNKNNNSSSLPINVVIHNSGHFFPEGYAFMEWVLGMINNDPRLKIEGDDYLDQNPEVKQRLEKTLSSMPMWPEIGFVKSEHGYILVKLNPRMLSEL